MGGRRRADRLYAGARGRTTIADAAKLGQRWRVQPKVDGTYAVVSTDRHGYITSMITRSGRALPLDGWRDVQWAPNSTIIAELETWTEAARRCAARRGYPCLWAFDALRVDGEQLASEPYGVRRDRLLWSESLLVNLDRDRPWRTDRHGRAHDAATGRYARRVPRGWRRATVVPSLPASKAAEAWSTWVEHGDDPIEGLVVVNLDARLGARNSKRKIKATTEIDCTVAKVENGHALVTYGGTSFVVGTGKRELAPGDVVEVRHDGWYEASTTPKFARIVRVRRDLV